MNCPLLISTNVFIPLLTFSGSLRWWLVIGGWGCTYWSPSAVVSLTGIKEGSQKVQAVKKLIQNLPKPNHDTMKLLFSHLHRYVYRRMERQISEWGQLLRKWWYCPLSHFFKSKQIQESSQVHRCWCHIVKLNSTFLTLLLYLYIWCLLLITEVLTVDLNMSTFCLTSIDSVGASTSCLKPTTTNVLINTHCAWLLSECSCGGSYKLCTHVPISYLVLLFFRVLAFSRKNLMSTQGIGIVFGPTLMWPELDGGNMAVNMVYQNQIVEFILIESRQIFNLDRKWSGPALRWTGSSDGLIFTHQS